VLTFAAVMRNLIRICCIVFVLCLVKTSMSQKVHELRIDGFITDLQGRPLAYVNILNYKAGTGTSSDSRGSFRIFAGTGDTIVFSSIGFETYIFQVPLTSGASIVPVHIYLREDTLQLPGITIYDWPRNLTELRQAVLNQKVDKPQIADLNLNAKITDLPPAGPGQTLPGMGDPGLTYTISGPITMLYNSFSRRGKSLRKYEELTGKDQVKAIIDKKYNPEIVRSITGFTTDEEIREFIEFCNLSTDFLKEASEYEIYCSVKECLAYYLSVKH